MSLFLPNELIELIVQYLPKPDLSRLSRVDRRFSHIALPVLYHTISGLRDKDLIHLLYCLCFNTRGPTLIRELKIDWRRASLKQSMMFLYLRAMMNHRSRAVFTSHKYFVDRMSLLNAVLRRLTKLSSLVIMVSLQDKEEKNAVRIFKKVQFSETLASLSTSLVCDRTVMTFLRDHPRINDLNIVWGCRAEALKEFPLSAEHLPMLRALGWTQAVPGEHVQHLLEGRAVEKINVTLNSEAVPKMITGLGHSSRKIISLYLKLRTRLRKETLALIAARFPRLRKLKFSLVYLPTLELMPVITASLARFPRLRVLTISVKELGYDDLEEFLVPYVQQWLVVCSTLMYVELPQIERRLDRDHDHPGQVIIRNLA